MRARTKAKHLIKRSRYSNATRSATVQPKRLTDTRACVRGLNQRGWVPAARCGRGCAQEARQGARVQERARACVSAALVAAQRQRAEP